MRSCSGTPAADALNLLAIYIPKTRGSEPMKSNDLPLTGQPLLRRSSKYLTLKIKKYFGIQDTDS
jgi:hypothetical protein